MRELNLMIPRGDIFGFLGPNGAGKTTTIRMMLGLIRPTSGSAFINGLDINKDPVNALKCVGAIVETPSFYGFLSGRDNLNILGKISGGVDGERVDEVLRLVGLFSRAEDKVKGYSQGMRQRLGIAQALLARPEIIILDEPTNGLDPSGILEMRRLIKKLASEQGITVFISSHLLHEIEAVCKHVAVINQGTLVAQGSVEDLLKRESLCLEIKVSDAVKARNIFSEMKFIPSVREDNGRGFEIQIGRDKVAEVNRRLVEGGVDVLALVPREASLEEFFLELTGGASGDRSSACAIGEVKDA